MKGISPRTILAASLGVVLSSALAAQPRSEKLSGSLCGWVTNSLGVPQVGAVVLLYNQNERLVSRTLTDDMGTFLFDALRPDLYSVRVVLSSFLPTLKKNVLVEPGMRSLLSINLAGVLSSIELMYSATGSQAVMSEDWKWALRSSVATRPVLRFTQGVNLSTPESTNKLSSVFSGTHGMVKVSAGEQTGASTWGSQADLGTAFALATSIFGTNQFQVTGNVGYAGVSGVPAAGFSTRYSHELPDGSNPEVKLTMRQLSLPARAGLAFITDQQGGSPALRTFSISLANEQRLADDLKLAYGFSLETVSFLERVNYFSPFARLSYGREETGQFELGYSSGLPPIALLAAQQAPGATLQQDLATVATFPRVSLLRGRARVQRTENYEIGYRRTFGSRTYGLAAYRESITNAAITMVAPPGYPETDVLPDLFSDSSVFNLGRYVSLGYMGSVTQSLSPSLELSVAAGSAGALVADSATLHTASADSVRGALHEERRYWAAAKFSGSLHQTGTNVTTGYLWSDRQTLNAGHYYLTQAIRPDTGLNVYVRQSLPAMAGLPGKLEATIELRNILREGYVPVTLPNGRRLVFMHTPRSVRGGVSFIF